MKQLRSFLIKAGIISGLLIFFVLISGITLSIFGPFHPGNLLFPIQYFAERGLGIIYIKPEDKTAYWLDLVDRRINDLSFRAGTSFELAALEYLNNSLDIATNSMSLDKINKAPNDVSSRFSILVFNINDVMNRLDVPLQRNKEIYEKFQAKIHTLLHLTQNPLLPPQETVLSSQGNVQSSQILIMKPTPTPSSVSGLIPFPPGSIGAVHAFYPLIGQHAIIQCSSCHDHGVYIGTLNTCIACHMIVRPTSHYPGKCDLCHTPVSWKDIHFDHISAQAGDCLSCHSSDQPKDHYLGQCSACHVIEAWNIIHFDHAMAGAVDCISCHDKNSPPNHYAGQCSRCHNTSDWKSVTFDHTGFTDCATCHADKAPANHFPGQCSRCHNTSNWTTVSFDHTGFTDCISCHSDKAPANHFSGQCSRCHNTSNWTSVSFDHSGLTDCSSCHAGDAPANHFAGQCSSCHSTSTWKGAVFDHSGLTDCISCHDKDAPAGHYPGQCSNCHSTGVSWKNAHFDHSGFTDCISCHSGNAPSNHYPGQCSNCHNTSSWQNAVFDHTGFTDCISCHLKDRPADHDSGQCSECHNTQGWGDAGENGLYNTIINVKSSFQSITCQLCHISSTTNPWKDNWIYNEVSQPIQY